MIILIGTLLAIALLFYIGYPLLAKTSPEETAEVDEGDEYHKLLYRRDTSYLALKDLEFDHETGKIDDTDYEELKKNFEMEAVGILKEIDAVKKDDTPKKKTEPKENSFCTACGVKLEPSDKFCGECGQRA